MSRTRVLGLAAARAAAAAALAAAASAPCANAARVVAALPNASPIATYGDTTAASVLDAPSGMYRLVLFGRDGVRVAPVAPRAVPFDVDLGPGPDGGLWAVYSRCAQEPAARTFPPVPIYTRGRGCGIHRLDIASGREAKVRGASTTVASEMLPAIWRGEIAFARVYERRAGRRRTLAYLYTRALRGAGAHSERQPGGARGGDGPLAIDLYGRRLGFIWSVAGTSGETPAYRARIVDTSTGRRRVLSSVGGGGLTRVWLSGVGFEQGRMYFGTDCRGDESGCRGRALDRRLMRYTISRGRLEKARLPAGALVTIGRGDGGTTYLRERLGGPAPCAGVAQDSAINGPPDSTCELVRVGDGELSFRDAGRGHGLR